MALGPPVMGGGVAAGPRHALPPQAGAQGFTVPEWDPALTVTSQENHRPLQKLLAAHRGISDGPLARSVSPPGCEPVGGPEAAREPGPGCVLRLGHLPLR